MGFSVFNFFLTALQIPDSPGSDDLHFRSESLDSQLKPHLVVSFSGTAVADCVGAFRFGDFYNSFGDNRTGEGGAQQIFVFINSASLDGGKNEILHKHLVQILDVQLGGSCLFRFFLQPGKLLTLADIGGNGDDLAVVVILLQPRNNNRGVQSAGIRQHYFFDLCHFNQLPKYFYYG